MISSTSACFANFQIALPVSRWLSVSRSMSGYFPKQGAVTAGKRDMNNRERTYRGANLLSVAGATAVASVKHAMVFILVRKLGVSARIPHCHGTWCGWTRFYRVNVRSTPDDCLGLKRNGEKLSTDSLRNNKWKCITTRGRGPGEAPSSTIAHSA